MERLFKNYFKIHHYSFSSFYFWVIILSLIPIYLNEGTIALKILGTGEQYILSDNFTECADQIYVEEQLKTPDPNDCRIIIIPEGKEENNIKLIFNRYIHNLEGMFANLTNITEVDFTNFDSTSVLIMRSMFFKCTSLTSIKLNNLNTASVVDIQSMFFDCSSLTELDLSSFDTSKVTDMDLVFRGCTNLVSLNIASFNTSNTNRMQGLFEKMTSIKYLDVSHFDTSKVKLMNLMFCDCRNLISLNLSNFNTAQVTDMAHMFFECHSLERLLLTNFDTSNVVLMVQMFRECRSLTTLDLSSFRTPNVQDMNFMFLNCGKLTSLDLSTFRTPNLEKMSEMFFGCRNLSSVDISNFETSKVKTMYGLFAYCEKLPKMDLSFFNTSSCEELSAIFFGCHELTSANLSNWDARKSKNLDLVFYDCYDLNSLDLSNLNTQNVESMDAMFHYCKSLTSLDVSSFNTESVKNMNKMFHHCEALKSLDLSNFYTPQLTTMSYIFQECKSMTSLDVSNFQVDKVINMEYAFTSCEQLLSLNLSSFNPILATNLGYLFYNCVNLRSLNLQNFHTNSAEHMEVMFANCIYLNSLDLSAFDTSHAQKLNHMFFNCQSLITLDISNFDTSSLVNAEWMFQFCYNLQYINFKKYKEIQNGLYVEGILDQITHFIVICLQENIDTLPKFKYWYDLKLCPTLDCSGDWRAVQKRYYPETNSCVPDCSSFKYENNYICYSKCPENADFCQPEVETTSKIIETTSKEITTNIETTAKIVETTSKEITTNIDTTSKGVTTFIDTTNIKTTEIIKAINVESTSNNKENIKTTNIEEISSNIPKNLIIAETSFPSTNKPMVEKSNIPFSSSYLIQSTIIDLNKNYIFQNITGESNEEIYLKIISDLIFKFLSAKGEEVLIEGKDNFFFEIVKSENERLSLKKKNTSINQLSKVDLGECEKILKEYYHIDLNVSLIIIKFEKIANNSMERAIQYEVYEPFNMTKLDLSLCNNIKINIYKPVVLSEELLDLYNKMKEMGYDLFDINDAFYRDICTPFTTPNGTDVLLDDRINYYYHNNELLCQSNCELSDYDIESQMLECECDISNSQIKTREIDKLNKKTVYQSFYDTLKFSNYKVLYCYKLAFHIDSVTINKGSIIAIIYFCFYFIFLTLYCYEGIRRFKIDVAKLIFKRKKKKNDFDTIEDKDTNNIIEKYQFEPEILETEKNKLGVRNSSKTLISKKSSAKVTSKFKNFPPKKKSLTKGSILITKTKSTTKLKINKNETIGDNYEGGLENYEINNLEFDEAIKLDKRSFITTYWSVLKREHLIIFTIIARNDHNLIYVKLARLIFLITTDMALNVFFFADETMHKMFLDYGKYNFLQQLYQIVLSALGTQIIEIFLCFLSMTDKHYFEIKNLEIKNKYNVFKIIKRVKIKIIIFFIFTFLLFAFYWYAIACFCAVYRNTQSAFIKDSITSFALSVIYPFILYLFPVLLRIISLRASKANLSCLYSLSDVIPFF